MKPIKEDKGRVRPVVEGDFQCDENGNSTRGYEVLSIVGYVKDDSTKLGYISKTDVPIGVPITDEDYWYPFQVIGVPKGDKGDKGDRGEDGKSAYDLYIEHGGTITPVEAWLASLQGKDGKDGKDGHNGVDGKDGKDGKDAIPLKLRISPDGQSIEISDDGGITWYIFEKNFNKLRVLGYLESLEDLPRSANVGDIYGVKLPDEEVEPGHSAYRLMINTVIGWDKDYTITKVYDYDTELPAHAANRSTVLVPVKYLTLDKEKIDGYKVYRFFLDKDGWTMILNTSEIFASKEDIINHGDNLYALVQGDTEHTYDLYRRLTDWVYFGTNASITYVLIQDVEEEGDDTNVPSGGAVKRLAEKIYSLYGTYIENPEFIRAYIDDDHKFLWGIRRTDGAIIYGAGVPPQIKEYIDEKVDELIPQVEKIIDFLDGIQYGYKTLPELLNEKVDKEEGKSLIDEDFANGIHYEENPEFIEVKLDNEERILEAIYKKDGTKLLPAGYDINGVVCKTLSNPEFLGVWTDDNNHLLAAIKENGDIYYGFGVPTQIKKYVENLVIPLVNSLEEKVKELGYYEENPEFVKILLDKDNRILKGITTNGFEYFGVGAKTDISETSIMTGPEFFKVYITSSNQILWALTRTGDVLYGAGVPSQIVKFVEDTIKPFRELFFYVDNPEFITIKLDAFDRILEGYKINGNKYFATPIENDSVNISSIKSGEYITVFTDLQNRIINSIDKEFQKVRYGGINLTEIKHDLDASVLEVHLADDDTDDIYTIENNDSTISLEIDDDWNVISVIDTNSNYDLSIDDDTNDVYLEENIN